MRGFINDFVTKYQSSLMIGALVGLSLSTVIFALKSQQLSDTVGRLEAERSEADAILSKIESSMGQVSQFRDQIDALTTTAVERELNDADSLEKRLSNIRVGLEFQHNYRSAEERVNNNRNRLADVAAQTRQIAQTMRAVATIMTLRKDILDGIPSITPTTGWVSSGFGERKSPFSGDIVNHRGLDIGAEEGTPVYATADGVVETVARSESYGNVVVLKHALDISTKFAHNSKIFVKEGQKIMRGDLVAAVGSTGRSTGPHLHYEVIVGKQTVDPLDYLLDRQLTDVSAQPTMDFVGGEEFAAKSAMKKSVATTHVRTSSAALSVTAIVVATVLMLLFVACIYWAIFGQGSFVRVASLVRPRLARSI